MFNSLLDAARCQVLLSAFESEYSSAQPESMNAPMRTITFVLSGVAATLCPFVRGGRHLHSDPSSMVRVPHLVSMASFEIFQVLECSVTCSSIASKISAELVSGRCLIHLDGV